PLHILKNRLPSRSANTADNEIIGHGSVPTLAKVAKRQTTNTPLRPPAGHMRTARLPEHAERGVGMQPGVMIFENSESICGGSATAVRCGASGKHEKKYPLRDLLTAGCNPWADRHRFWFFL